MGHNARLHDFAWLSPSTQSSPWIRRAAPAPSTATRPPAAASGRNCAPCSAAASTSSSTAAPGGLFRCRLLEAVGVGNRLREPALGLFFKLLEPGFDLWLDVELLQICHAQLSMCWHHCQLGLQPRTHSGHFECGKVLQSTNESRRTSLSCTLAQRHSRRTHARTHARTHTHTHNARACHMGTTPC